MPSPGRVTYEDTGDPGWDAMRYVHRLLVIDEPWTQWHADGFSWWGHTLEQRFRWEGPVEIEDLPTWFVSVETDFLRGVTDWEAGSALVNRWNASLEFGVGALVLEGDRIRLRSRTYLLPESAEDRARVLSSWGIIANAVASQLARVHGADPRELIALGVDPGWVVDARAHPVSGPRGTPDEMLTVVGALYQPQGREPARETIDLSLDQAVHDFMAKDIESIGGDIARTVMALWRRQYGVLTWQLERTYENPALGYGVRSRLFVDLDGGPVVVSSALAEHLNALEWTAAYPLIGGGAWAVWADGGAPRLVYTAFSPNAELRGRLAPLLAGNASFRGRWLDGVLVKASVEAAA